MKYLYILLILFIFSSSACRPSTELFIIACTPEQLHEMNKYYMIEKGYEVQKIITYVDGMDDNQCPMIKLIKYHYEKQ